MTAASAKPNGPHSVRHAAPGRSWRRWPVRWWWWRVIGGGGGGGYDPARAFARIDTNGDGFLDKAEIDAASAERFRRMDANGDGVVTPDERMAGRGGMHRHGEHGGDGAPTGGQPTPPPSTPQ